MGLRVPDRVHIMPVGYERSRVVDAAEEYKADRVLLIGHEDNSEEGDSHWQYVLSELEEKGIPTEHVFCDIFNLYDSLGTMAELIGQFEDDEVFINISTGSKITAVAGAIAAMVQDVTAYYIKAESYDGIPQGIGSEFELPHYPIDPPNRDQVLMLQYIKKENMKEEYPTKGELIFFGNHNSLAFARESNGDKGNYRLLDKHILNPLVESGYVTISKSGRNKVVQITEDGLGAVRAFQFLTPDDEDVIWNPKERAKQGK